MQPFSYQDGELYCENVPVAKLAEQHGTPVWIYSKSFILGQLKQIQTAFAEVDPVICYSVKANSNQAVLKTLAGLGAGMDVVSEGELRRALAAGVQPAKITFSGVGKTQAEMAFALAHDILCFNVESEPELALLSAEQALGHRQTLLGNRVLLAQQSAPLTPICL